jgi:hypothetical protein
MMILEAIAASLGNAGLDAVRQPSNALAAASPGNAAKTVFQLNQFPTTLDTTTYRDALSGSNPNGDWRALFAFRQLVDPVPAFSRSYSPSADSTEQVYKTLLTGASVDGESEFASGVLSDAMDRFQSETFANLDGNPGVWRPVYAVPEDWYAAGADRFKSLNIDLDSLGSSDSPFGIIGGDDSLELRLGGDKAPGSSGLSSGTKLHSIRMEYLLVSFRRPWLNPLLFRSGDWFLSGQDAGFCSSGSISRNDGVLPLLPTGMLISRSVDISADWSNADASLVKDAKSAGKAVFLGPFMLSAPASAGSTLQVIGWTSDLVPFSPKITKKLAGSILVDNSGAFVSRFSVEWNEGADRHSQQSGTYPVLASREIGIPVNATKIVVKIDIMTFPAPVETWKTVAAYQFDTPVVKRYGLSGVTWNPAIKEA